MPISFNTLTKTKQAVRQTGPNTGSHNVYIMHIFHKVSPCGTYDATAFLKKKKKEKKDRHDAMAISTQQSLHLSNMYLIKESGITQSQASVKSNCN